ncbi:exostosin-3-like isoform X2 [Ornithodoros turicata]
MWSVKPLVTTMAASESKYHKLSWWKTLGYRCAAVKVYRVYILLLFLLIAAPFYIHYYISKISIDSYSTDDVRRIVQLDDIHILEANDLKLRIEELIRIKASVSSELRDLEHRRQKLQSEIVSLSQSLEEVKRESSASHLELERMQSSLKQALLAQNELASRNVPRLFLPLRLVPASENNDIVTMHPASEPSQACHMHTCFDYSRCSLASGFPVYFYNPDDTNVDPAVKRTITDTLNTNVHVTFDPDVACVYIVLLTGSLQHTSVQAYLKGLRFWGTGGQNHLLLSLPGHGQGPVHTADAERAVIVQSTFLTNEFRHNFDVVLPSFPKQDNDSSPAWSVASALVPARRKYLLTFRGELKGKQNGTQTYDAIVSALKRMQTSATDDGLHLEFVCAALDQGQEEGGEWSLCGSLEHRMVLLRESTFSLIIAPSDIYSTTASSLRRLSEALQCGAIPVILGADHLTLPFAEFLDWSRVALLLPVARVTELHFILRTYGDSDLVELRHRGRLVWEHYLSTPSRVVSAVLSLMRARLGIPAHPAKEEPALSVFNSTFRPVTMDSPMPSDVEVEESLGPLEQPFPSLPYQRNFSVTINEQGKVWNELYDPHTLYPFGTDDPVLPSEAKFIGSSFGFRPIAEGAGGSGKEFGEALGGNVPREQFTVVMLTYEREAVMVDSLQRLHNLPHLNKVIVVWNSPKPPSSDLRWPEIGVPIEVIRAKKNSLNNRFLPYSSIETEAILSVDDDAHLRHDEIVFGFRVWREARDRIVGFPGRYHAWDNNNRAWLYNSNYSCELSMVLTGAAFFHKHYSYLYTNVMPQAIRDKVDEYMNCEDIAMNFLVSHVTRKPPLKVTSRWTFRCPGCAASLSEDDSHFQERHKCINFFAQVYGYMPLLYTQFRLDSVLFKTRIPHDKQKCFKYI